MGDVLHTRFWGDPWLLARPLKEEFPSLFKLSTWNNNIIAQMGWKEGAIWRWTISWYKSFQLVELLDLEALTTLLEHYSLDSLGSDKILWVLDQFRVNSVKSFTQ